MSNDLSTGDAAPDFTTTTDTGEILSLSDLRGKKVVLYFYPKDDTPGCTKQACGFRDSYADFEAHGALVFGVSPQGEGSHAKFRAKYDLPFTLLVDEDHKIAETYGVWGEKKMYGRSYMGVTRSHFVIDEAGTIVDAQAKISPKESPTKALASVSG
jgi:peroxiredoxin Q/BCP|tara:strand:+ start:417 stop:884 length:468 start_codon:yes stop_codon:yes gene_type:complete